MQNLKMELRAIEQENSRLNKDVRELNFEKKVQFNNLEKAETYIVTLMDQIKT